MTFTEIVTDDEIALVERAKANPDSFAEIYQLFFPQIFKYTLFRVYDQHTAEDLTAQVFEQVMEDLPRYDPRKARLGAWMYGIARHLVNDYFRGKNRHLRLHPAAVIDTTEEKTDPEGIALRHEDHRRLVAALNCLPEREREMIALKFSGQLTNRRIAELTGLREGHIAIIIFRALRRLRHELGQGDDNEK